ncbi:putative secreted protein (Por secretion system target) [Mesonia algae]|uniref:Putative secreted protein (Por secretion system target) n=1 Tax=Mesonia algae TaxID=213248 RepID=A0A2W7I5F6_9FLAO|nr:T9SS type A sorting domain-containing protein [Mesonia algae]PZW41439.1 putative secreted protein (Por secretion system target) [Mesonia algae]
MKQQLHYWACLCLFILINTSLFGQNEGSDFPNTGNGPTYTLSAGVNQFSGRVTTPTDGQDRFQIQLLSGQNITSINSTITQNSSPVGFFTIGASTKTFPGGNISPVPSSPGTYSVLVSTNFSVGENWTITINVTAAPVCSMTASISSQTNIACNGSATGSLTVTPSSGTAPYTYLWDDGTAQTTATATGLAAGTYEVIVTDDNGCTANANATITEPAPLSPINSTTLVYEEVFVQGQNYCPGSDNYDNWNTFRAGIDTNIGYSSVKISGTQLSNGLTLDDPVAANQIAQALATGTATSVTVNGATWTVGIGCNTSCTLPGDAVELNVNNGGGCSCGQNPTIRPCIGNANWGSFGTNGACGAVTQTMRVELIGQNVTVSNVSCNGNNDGSIALDIEGGMAPYTYVWSPGNLIGQGTNTISGLAIGTYSVTVTDANGCTNTGSATITEPEVLEASTVVNANETCEIGNNGIATASATGGTAPYTYLWSNAETTASITGLAAGTYNVTITDANGCTDAGSVTIEQISSIMAASVVDANVTCNGGTDGAATVNISSGGAAPFTYLWSNSATTASLSGVAAGTYDVTITDANGCTATSSVTITEPTTLVATSVVDTNITCNAGTDGSATASATGGTAPYTYLWSNAATTASIVGVAAGTYNVTITDANGCIDTSSVTITEPTAFIAASVVDTNISCNSGADGSATASAIGGTAPYTYLWSNAATTASLVNVTAGTYNVTITDANGCTDTSSVTITEPTALVATSVIDANVSCNGGSEGAATASATGGIAPYTYLWSNTATTASLSGVAAGTYNVTITDANGCTDNSSVTITEPTALVAASVVDANVTCNGGTDGAATVNISSDGAAPFTYLWSNSVTTASLSGVAAGTYDVTITDANGCTATSSVTITEPTTLVATSVVDTNITCNAGTDGSATASATGGTAPYTYLWSNAATTASIVNVAAGTYSVTITDANGCTDISSVTITEPTVLVAASVVDSNVSCNGESEGNATASATGGTAPYTYLWSNAATTANIADIAAGTYSVTVTDANGCTDTASVTITEPTAISTSITATTVSCNGGTDATIDLTVMGGTAPYTYLWDNSAITEDLSGLTSGTYEVIVTDDYGCTATTSVTVTEPTTISISALVTSLTCNGASDGAIDLTVSGGTAPYSFSWSNTMTTEDISNLSEGNYNVTVTDANGCTAAESVTLIINDDEAPIAICQDITITLDDTGNASIIAEDVDNGSTDNCAITSYSIDIDTFDCTMLGLNTVTLTVTDSNGNTSTCSSIVTVEDTELPTLSCQAITINLDENGNAVIVPEDILIDSNDNCGIDSISLDIDTFGCEDVGMDVEITVFAQDASGNIASCTTTVTVNDVIAPVITCMDEIDVVGNIGNNYYVVPDFIADGDVSAIDNCDGAILNISQSPPAGTLLQEGEHNITFITEDQYGNTSVCITTLNIEIDLKVSNIDSSLKSISLYPNPADNFVRIENPQHIQLEEMTVYNLNGKKVMTLNLESYVDNNVINVSKLQAAQYFIIIKSINNGVIVKQLIKE